MPTEYRGKVKQKVWVRPTCLDNSDPTHLGQRARRDFKEECRSEDWSVDVAAPDVIDEANELGDLPLPDSDDPRIEC